MYAVIPCKFSDYAETASVKALELHEFAKLQTRIMVDNTVKTHDMKLNT